MLRMDREHYRSRMAQRVYDLDDRVEEALRRYRPLVSYADDPLERALGRLASTRDLLIDRFDRLSVAPAGDWTMAREDLEDALRFIRKAFDQVWLAADDHIPPSLRHYPKQLAG